MDLINFIIVNFWMILLVVAGLIYLPATTMLLLILKAFTHIPTGWMVFFAIVGYIFEYVYIHHKSS